MLLAMQEGVRYGITFVVLVALVLAQIRLHLLARFWTWFQGLDPRVRACVGFIIVVVLWFEVPRILLWVVRGV